MVVTKSTEVDSVLPFNETSPEMEDNLASLAINKPNINDRKILPLPLFLNVKSLLNYLFL